MPSIKENIKNELLSLIETEKSNIEKRWNVLGSIADSGEFYQIQCEENFIKKLERFAKSI